MPPPTSIRAAIQACRPTSLSTAHLRLASLSRKYASSPDSPGNNIKKGFPNPADTQTPSSFRSKKSRHVADDIPNAPHKFSPPPLPPKDTEGLLSADPQESAPESFVSSSKDSTSETIPPLNVLAAFHRPLKHQPKYDIPTCELHLRSYSVRNLEFMADFALRAAFYLKLPAVGPIPLPKQRERWTMPRSNFVHKKSQENFERITYKRLLQIKDGHRDTVEVWLSFLRRHQFYGVGMKANIWDYESLDVAENMDKQTDDVQKDLDAKLGMFGWNKQVADDKSINEMLQQFGPQRVGVPMTNLREASQTANNKT